MSRPHRQDQEQLDVIVKMALEVVTRWMVSVLLLVFGAGKDPVAALKDAIRQTSGQLALAMTAAGAAGGAVAGASLWTAGLGFFGGIGYWLGLIAMPLWAPVVGGVVGVVAGAAGAMAIVSRLHGSAARDAAMLHLHVMNVLVWADGTVDQVEREALAAVEDRFVAAGIAVDDTKRLLADAPRTPDDFALDPAKFGEELRRAALVDGWQLVLVSEGSHGAAERAFDRLSRRLSLEAAATELKALAVERLASRSTQLCAAVVATRFMSAGLDGKQLEQSVGALAAFDPTGAAARRGREVLASAVSLGVAAAAISEVAQGNTKVLPLVGQAYAASYNAILQAHGDPGPVRARAVQLGGQLGAAEKEVGAYVDQVRSAIDEQVGKARATS